MVDADGAREVPAKDPFRGLAEIVGQKSVAPLPNLPAFVGGAVGYFSYDAVRYLERLPDAPPDDLDVPEAYFAVTDTLVVFDHLRHKVLVISLVDTSNLRDVDGEGFAAAYRRAADDVRRVSERLAAPLVRRSLPDGAGGSFEVSSNFSEARCTPKRLGRRRNTSGRGMHFRSYRPNDSPRRSETSTRCCSTGASVP